MIKYISSPARQPKTKGLDLFLEVLSNRAITQPKFGDDYQYQTWPVLYNDISFCRLWMKSMHPFKGYWVETVMDTWSPCVCHAMQANKNVYHISMVYPQYLDRYAWAKIVRTIWAGSILFAIHLPPFRSIKKKPCRFLKKKSSIIMVKG